ncbi:MAG: hydrogenase 3 maturation endopeptidase HyCI [Candidatus Omnitrophica bacterium]|nr:hydrogenase 3 maturation endopeptidase HyCI [Candidatus Omnitrophota bacterium]
METWTKKLSKKIMGWKKICILGVGSIEKGDDGIGVYCAEELKKRMNIPRILVIDAGNVPESWTGKIRAFSPDWTIIIDACKKGEKPGSIFIVDKNAISYSDVSSHRIPLSVVMSFLEQTIKTKVIFIGIEPENMDGENLSENIKHSGEKIVEFLSIL